MTTNSTSRKLYKGVIIPFGEKYRMKKIDDVCWAIQILTIPQKGKFKGQMVWKNYSYHSDLASTCKSLAKDVTDQSDAASLLGYVKELEAVCDDLKRTVREMTDGA